MMEELQSLKVVSVGGLNSAVNHIQLSDFEPGSAVDLVNFEASLYGGYRRLSGFQAYDLSHAEVDSAGAEGAILVVAFLGDTLIAARKQKAGNTYDFYKYSGGSGWVKATTTFTKSSVGVTRLRFKEYNFDGTPKIVFVDGVNPAMLYDGTTFSQVKSTNTGADYTHAGGNQAIDNPEFVEIFRNHIFLAKGHLVVHSAPLKDYDFTVAGGAGQLPAGYLINMIKPFRDNLYVTGQTNIKKVSVDSSLNFVLNDVTTQIGCLAGDSVQEFNGNLIFLSQDGFRPISGTDYIGDVNLDNVSKKIQQLVSSQSQTNDMAQLTSVVIRSKTQIRFFFNSPFKEQSETFGIIGCIRSAADGSQSWEWGQIKGIRASCTTSKYIGATEYVIHGDYNGKVYRQEQGFTFDGAPVQAIYTTPYLDFGDAGIRKNVRKIQLFIRPEGDTIINTRLTYDWNDPEKLNPDSYTFESFNTSAQYGTAVYGTATYAVAQTPVLTTNVEGGGFSVQMKYTTFDTNAPYTIQGALYDFIVEGRK